MIFLESAPTKKKRKQAVLITNFTKFKLNQVDLVVSTLSFVAELT